MSRESLYSLTLAEFLNAWKGYTDEKVMDQRGRMEAAQFLMEAWVKKAPTLPWQKEDTKPYTEEEKRAIADSHEGKKVTQILTAEGWKDVDS